MQKERRFFKRITINASCQFFIQNATEQRDFSGVINNICEDGAGLVITDTKYLTLIDEKLKVGDELVFQGYDEFIYCNKEISEVISGKLEVTRIEKTPDVYYIGCKIIPPNAELEMYIMKRKFSDFCDSNLF